MWRDTQESLWFCPASVLNYRLNLNNLHGHLLHYTKQTLKKFTLMNRARDTQVESNCWIKPLQEICLYRYQTWTKMTRENITAPSHLNNTSTSDSVFKVYFLRCTAVVSFNIFSVYIIHEKIWTVRRRWSSKIIYIVYIILESHIHTLHTTNEPIKQTEEPTTKQSEKLEKQRK